MQKFISCYSPEPRHPVSLLLTAETDGSGTHAHVLGDLDEGVGHLRGVGTAGLDADGRDLGAGGVEEGGGALHGVEGGGLAGGGCNFCISCNSQWLLEQLFGLTRVGTAELLQLLRLHHWRPSDLDGALSGHRGHLGRSHAEGGGHCAGGGVCKTGRDEGFDGR